MNGRAKTLIHRLPNTLPRRQVCHLCSMRMNGGDKQAHPKDLLNKPSENQEQLSRFLYLCPPRSETENIQMWTKQKGSLPSTTDDGFTGIALPTAWVRCWGSKWSVCGWKRLGARKLWGSGGVERRYASLPIGNRNTSRVFSILNDTGYQIQF